MVATAFDVDAEVSRLIHQKLVELPTYPGVALKLQKLLSGGDYDFEALTRLVQADLALTAQVMRAANSAFYRATAPITTLTPAISRIGAKELANIAIAGTLGLTANAQGPLAVLRKDAWRLALTTAVIAQELAPGEQVNPGEAFLAGLLHDFGVTIALTCFELVLETHPEVTPRTLAQWRDDALRFHVELGLALATDWNLPAFVSEVIVNDGGDDTTGLAHAAVVKLVTAAARVARSVLESPSVEVALRGLTGFSARSVERLEGVVPRLPSYLQSFEEPGAAPSSPTPAPRRAQGPLVAPPVNPVTPPAPAPEAPRDAVELHLTILKKGARMSYRATHWSAGSLRLVGAAPQPERHLVNIEFDKAQLCATVVACTPVAEGFAVELKPFAMDRATAAAFARIGASQRAA
jgi:HD-like signal output (HDOD) protein